MEKRFIVPTIAVIILVLVSGCGNKNLRINGNLDTRIIISESIQLNDALKRERFENILIEGDNGVAALISADTAREIAIERLEKGFSADSDGLPPVCNINNISSISVYASCYDYEIRFFDGINEIERLTPFNYMMKEFDFLGESSKNGHSARKFKRKSDYLHNWMKEDSILVITEKETNKILQKPEFEEIIFDGKQLVYNNERIIGLWANPPLRMEQLTGIFEDSLVNSNLMVIFIDGLGVKYIDQNSEAVKLFTEDYTFSPLLSAYPSKTKKNSWVMMSGKDHKLEGRKVLEEFEVHESILVEGDHVYNTSAIPMIQCTDMDKDGFIDEEIFEAAREAVKKKPDFLIVHFHSFDDFGHETGAYSPERDSILALNYKYVKSLTDNWNGKVMLVSDHGMHTKSNGKGTHGSLMLDDMLAIKGETK